MKAKKMIACGALTLALTAALAGCATNAQVPTVKEGRFNFHITYEENGEEKVYNGVYVCKFEGVYVSVYGTGRDWSGYLENGDEYAMVPLQTNDDGTIYMDLGFYPEYFMSDPDYPVEDPTPRMFLIFHSDDPSVTSMEWDLDFEKEYGIKLISCTYDPPVENTYKEKLSCASCHFGIN